jgi:hypothetical protein
VFLQSLLLPDGAGLHRRSNKICFHRSTGWALACGSAGEAAEVRQFREQQVAQTWAHFAFVCGSSIRPPIANVFRAAMKRRCFHRWRRTRVRKGVFPDVEPRRKANRVSHGFRRGPHYAAPAGAVERPFSAACEAPPFRQPPRASRRGEKYGLMILDPCGILPLTPQGSIEVSTLAGSARHGRSSGGAAPGY